MKLSRREISSRLTGVFSPGDHVPGHLLVGPSSSSMLSYTRCCTFGIIDEMSA